MAIRMFESSIVVPFLLLYFDIGKTAARQKLVVNMQNIEYTLNLFRGCDIFLLSETIELENFHQVQYPISLYSNFRTFNLHFESHPYLSVGMRVRQILARKAGVPLSLASVRTVLKPRNCKAQIVALEPQETPYFETFSCLESVQLYFMLIHLVPNPIPSRLQPLLEKSTQLMSYALRRTLYAGDGRYFYHMMSHISTNSQPDVGRIRTKFPQGVVRRFHLFSLCQKCNRPLDGNLIRLMRFVDITDEATARTAYDSRPHDQNTLHREVLEHQYLYSTVSVHFSQHERDEFFIRGYNSWTDISRSTPRRIISERIQNPNVLLIWDLKRRYSNMSLSIYGLIWSFYKTGEKQKDFELQPAEHSHNPRYNNEVVFSPGYIGASRQNTLFIYTKDVAITFVTYDNVTMARRSGIFLAPFDQATWILTFLTTLIFSLVMIATSKIDGNLLLRRLNAFVMMWRILLENFNDESASCTANRRVFVILTTGLALTAVVLTNGYKGVLTSDLTFAATYSGPEEISQVIRANWTTAPFSYSVEADKKSGDFFKNTNNVGVMAPMLSHLLRIFSTDEYKGRFDLPSETDPFKIGLQTKDYDTILKRLITDVLYERRDVYRRCNLTQAAYLVFKPKSEPLSELYLPRVCLNPLRYKPFIVGKQSFFPAGVGWGGAEGLHHTGKVFQSIRNLVETGVHSRLEKLTGDAGKANLKVVDYTVEPLEVREPVPLSLDNPLISSALSLWWRIILAAITIAILEVAVCVCRLLFSFEEVVANLS